MAMKLRLDWPKCPDGVEASPTSKEWRPLAEADGAGFGTGVLSGTPGKLVEVPIPRFSNKSERIEFASYETTARALDNTFVVPFVNADTTEARRRFLSDYGFPVLPTAWAPQTERWIAYLQGILRKLLFAAGGDTPNEGTDTMNDIFSAYDVTNAFSPLSPWSPPVNLPGGPLPFGGSSPGPVPLSLRPTMEFQDDEAAPQIVYRPPTLYAMMMMECAVIASNGTRAYECRYCSKVYLVGALTSRRAKGYYCSNSCRVMGLRSRKKPKLRTE
jgi:hypothetical protein